MAAEPGRTAPLNDQLEAEDFAALYSINCVCSTSSQRPNL